MSDPMKNFLNTENQLVSMPAKRKVRLQALVYLAEKFEPGRTYTEREVNDVLNAWHTFGDPATLRRELYDYRFLGREATGATYWLEENQPTLQELVDKLR